MQGRCTSENVYERDSRRCWAKASGRASGHDLNASSEQLAMLKLDTTYIDVTAYLHCAASACTCSDLTAAGLGKRKWLGSKLLQSLLNL